MTKTVTIALDAMGGDHAPQMVIEGAEMSRQRNPGIQFLLFGDEAQIKPLLARYPELEKVSTLHHTDVVIRNEDKPSAALRQGKNSSMRLAIDAVADGKADCIVSAGNTGALMATAKIVLKALPGVTRPAIGSTFPGLKQHTVMLDLGANVNRDARSLVEFAILGGIYARAVLGRENPTIGLLNVGSEDMKGNDAVKEASLQLQEMELPGTFAGFVEGDDIPAGTVDVVVMDGFSGNVVLKAVEGTAKMIAEMLKQSLGSSLMAKIGYLFARPALKKMKLRVDPRVHNGGMFLGLNGACVKSHGGTDAYGFSHALQVGIDVVTNDFNAKVQEAMSQHALQNMSPEKAEA